MRQSSFFCVSRATGVLKRAAQQGEAVALRKSPVRTPAMLAANRANAQKSTGPSRPQASPRAALNSLKHGAYAVRFPGTLLRARDLQGAAHYRWFRSEIAATFETGWSADGRQGRSNSAAAWCRARDLVPLRAKPESPLVSWRLCSRLHDQSRIPACGGWTDRGGLGWHFGCNGPATGRCSGRCELCRKANCSRPRRRVAGSNSAGTGSVFRSHEPGPWEEWILEREARNRGYCRAEENP